MLVSGIRVVSCPKGIQIKFIRDNYEDLRTAEVFATSEKRESFGRRAPMIAAVYVLRELKLIDDAVIVDFFRILNTGTVQAKEARDPSAPLVAVRQIMTQYNGKYAGGAAQSEQFNIIVQALIDYSKNKNRRQTYKVKDEPMVMFNTVRNMKGLAEGE